MNRRSDETERNLDKFTLALLVFISIFQGIKLLMIDEKISEIQKAVSKENGR